ncbi:MAG: ABC transporter ATP-binding protein [Candidatus Fischerbacteria bacterium RBG_13_37_8]|uniref:ABC transporter ATP-binding protein n=1 Tax=Candidatus Fischerbacteria bacterium RBG_13_37_8 TaxID=1817863 RepID=A0A1F5VWT8_9BACT|nr:MAG: ABC transporter ATP-binding protein [Candidatus Fischerbacteria bacterium RBG_13_37_8]
MLVFKILFKNLFRHKLRTFLTIIGVAVAVLAFGLLKTIIAAWYYGVQGSAANRLIVRHAVAFIFPLPISYQDKIARVPGVTRVSHATWFQGTYIDMQHFFPRMAVDPKTYFKLYPEFLVSQQEMADFLRERSACIIGAKIAKQYKLKIGDIIPITGDIYPGNWEFTVRGIYYGKYEYTDQTQLLFQWDYLEQQLRQVTPGRAGYIGWYVVWIDNADNAAAISQSIDNLFKNSTAETTTETEKAFQQSFVSLSSAIITAIEVISYLIVGIILLVLGNTMIMTARERMTEFAVLRTLGFGAFKVAGLILGEALVISCLGGAIGLFLTFPIIGAVAASLSNFFPVFKIETSTLLMIISLGIIVGISSSIIPIHRAVTIRIVDALRQIE